MNERTTNDLVEAWLEDLGLAQYAAVFKANDVDFRTLVFIDDEDLKELGVSLGHRRVLLAAIKSLEQDDAFHQQAARQPERSTRGEAERRQLTVMFCDLVGSTELSRRLDPEDLREFLRRYQNMVTNCVVRYEGYVARFLGDGVLAYFGWPQAHEDQAERAVRSGLDVASGIKNVKLDIKEVPRVRIGLATGLVVVGDLVGDVTIESEAVTGETPNLAARLQTIAKEGQVVIDPTTRRLLGTAFELEELGAHPLNGFSEKVFAWGVIRESAAESRFEATRGSTLTRLVAREHELGLMRERWELAKGGEGQVILLSGEAGIGKSRMVQDFRRQLGDETRFNLYYQCSPHHTSSAFFPVIQRLQKAAGFSSNDNSETKLDKMEKLLEDMQQDVGSVAPLFAALLSLPGEDRFGPLNLTPQQLRHRTIEALVAQVLSLSRQRPVLFVVEDAHWIDPSTVDFVGEMMPRVTNHQTLIVITYRPEQVPKWPMHTHMSSVTLNRLGRRQAAQIAHSVGGEDLIGAIIEQIVARADGVPLYVEELTKSVLESVSSRDTAVIDLIPATLQSSLEARLGRLNEAKEIAQIGAVIGREFSYQLLSAVTDKPETELNSALDKLVESELVFRQGVPPNVTYTFKHSLVQDAAYTTILVSRRRRLHASIVEAIENEVSDQTSEKIVVLAHHAYHGEIWDKAFTYLKQAGLKAMDRAAIREARAQFEKALSVGTHLPETEEFLAQDIDLRFDLRNALWSIGAFQDILANLRDAERLAMKLCDPRRIGWISVFMSASLWQLGRFKEARAAATEALDASKDASDLPLEVGARFYLGCAHITAGNYVEAEELFTIISRSLVGELERDRCGLPFVPAVVARSWLVWSLAERGEFDNGKVHAQEALDIAEAVGHPFNLAHIYYDLGYFYGVKGELDQAVEALDKALALVREWNLTYLSPFIMGFFGHVCALSGRVEEGTALLKQATSDYESMGLGLFRSLVTMQLGEALWLGRHLEESMTTAQDALTLARKRGERGHEAYTLRLLGEITGDPDWNGNGNAEEYFTEGLNLGDSLGMQPLVAHCHLGLGRLYQHQGDGGKSKRTFGASQYVI